MCLYSPKKSKYALFSRVGNFRQSAFIHALLDLFPAAILYWWQVRDHFIRGTKKDLRTGIAYVHLGEATQIRFGGFQISTLESLLPYLVCLTDIKGSQVM